ncbi:MAG: FG-GAP-like repeat-containing protein [Planctomycetota bacterium]|jgi:hypothetical protein
MRIPLATPTLLLLAVAVVTPGAEAQLLKPDLQPTAFTTTNTTLKEGAQVDIYNRVRQNNIFTTSGACKVGVYLSRDATITTADTLWFEINNPALGWLQEGYGTFRRTVPRYINGTCYLGLYVDNRFQVAETNENNNTRNIKVTCVTRKPDWTPTAFTVTGAVTAGQKVTFTTTIKNQGEITGPSFKIGYYASADPSITTSDDVLGTFSVPAISPTKSSQVKHTVTLPTKLVGGACWIGVFVDYAGAALELSEGNNTRSKEVFSLAVPGQSPRFLLNGDAARDQLGWAVAGAGDVNDDGFDDLVAGAPYANKGSLNDVGLVRIYSGRTGGILRSLYGVAPYEALGTSVAGCGDVNGDGFDDVVAGAPGIGTGLVRVFSGKDGAVLHTVYGDTQNNKLGYSVAGLGDVNADGYDDFVAGCRYGNFARTFSGRTGKAIRTFRGSGYFGISVAGVGDVDGDGHGDLVIGAPYVYPGGRAYLYSGNSGKLLATLSKAGMYISAYFGWSVGAAGDFDRDGVPDVVVGAYADRPGSSSEYERGSAHVFSGKTHKLLTSLNGRNKYDKMGWWVSGAGDLNADGYDDVIVAALTADIRTYNSQTGNVMVLSGKDRKPLLSLLGSGHYDYFGHAVCAVGDINDDGIPDLAVGAPLDDNKGSASGSVQVYQSSGKTVGRWRNYGAGCPSSLGRQPRNSMSAPPNLGQQTAFVLRAAPASTTVALNIAMTRSNVDFGMMGAPGCTGLAMPVYQFFLQSSSQGTLTLPVTVPSNTSLLGNSAYTQWWAVDLKQNALGVIVSDGVKLTVGKL